MSTARAVTPLRMAALAGLFAVALLWLRPGATPPSPATAQETVRILAGDTWFCDASHGAPPFTPCDTKVTAGDTFVWDLSPSSLRHTPTEGGGGSRPPSIGAGPLWDSGFISDG